MVSRDALIIAASERVQIFFVQLADHARHVLSVVINCASNLVRSLDGRDGELSRRYDETLVNEDVCSQGMVNRRECELIVIVCLPQLGSEAQVIIAVVCLEFIASDFV